MTRKKLVLVKLGGGLITDKSNPHTVREEHIAIFAKSLKQARQDNNDIDYIIGNGAGSFGHFTAHKYGLRSGAKTPHQMYGMCLTHNGVQRLNVIVADALAKEDIPVFAMSPSAILKYSDGQVSREDFSLLKEILAIGCIPLLHGDTVIDTTRGTTILSTEEVLYRCMLALSAAYHKVTTIYLLDVEGLLDSSGSVISRLERGVDITTLDTLEHDVTGGIIGKVESARKAARQGGDVYIVSGKTPGMFEPVVKGLPVGTKVL